MQALIDTLSLHQPYYTVRNYDFSKSQQFLPAQFVQLVLPTAFLKDEALPDWVFRPLFDMGGNPLVDIRRAL